MAQVHAQIPQPGELWLSRPPYLMVARIIAVEGGAGEGEAIVSYELLDDDGHVVEQVTHATLDEAWWRTFQPLKRRYG